MYSNMNLYELIFVFVLVQQAFLPTMPEDMLFVAQQAMGRVSWYCKSKT
jgi:hypothetical protein